MNQENNEYNEYLHTFIFIQLYTYIFSISLMLYSLKFSPGFSFSKSVVMQ
jgi:hypothetical protein